VSRKKKHEEHENAERWLVSYADFITLLFAFFTVLYATSKSDAAKLEAVVDSMNAAFEGGMPQAVLDTLSMGSTDSPLDPVHMSLEGASTPTLESLRQNLAGSLSDRTVQIGLVEQSLTLKLPGKLLYAPGSADLHPAAYPLLGDIADALGGTPATIEVTGHADGVPIGDGSPYADNWELATARALSTVRWLERRGLKANQLVAAGTVTMTDDAEARSVTLNVKCDDAAVAGEIVEKLRAAGASFDPK
jgi:chemotaxis protein MotB